MHCFIHKFKLTLKKLYGKNFLKLHTDKLYFQHRADITVQTTQTTNRTKTKY